MQQRLADRQAVARGERAVGGGAGVEQRGGAEEWSRGVEKRGGAGVEQRGVVGGSGWERECDDVALSFLRTGVNTRR